MEQAACVRAVPPMVKAMRAVRSGGFMVLRVEVLGAEEVRRASLALGEGGASGRASGVSWGVFSRPVGAQGYVIGVSQGLRFASSLG